MKMNKSFKTISVFFALSCFTWTNAQMKATPSYWGKINEPTVPAMATRIIQPNVYLNFQLNVDELKDKLQNAKLKTDSNPTEILIALPHPDGQFYEYQVFLNTTMHPGLQATFPEIRSYDAIATNQSGNTVKLDITPQGFHAMILSPTESTIFIDPYSFGGGDISNYIVYYKKDFKTDKIFDCSFVSEEGSIDVGQEDFTPKAFGTCELRTYRLALSATGEYTTFQGGTVALAQAAQVTTMNRVNGVYERDMAITMVIIPNNDLLIYTNSASDPFTNGTPNSMITQNQTAVNNAIGSSNYDIGHVFGTNSGGLAGLGVVCGTQKARGVTGSGAPVGDAFDIDYVAHEMGHQFSGNHSFNNSCSGNRNNNTAVEPGSGTTIMGYAGICAPNIQSNSDDHFHGRNLQEIGAFITGASHTCPVKTPLNNTAPSISSTVGTVTIPANTPFALTAIATDTDGNTLTYCWEQINNEISTQAPVASSTGGPNFRSITPSTSPTRYFPTIASQMTNGPFTWEVIPSVSRTMNFRVTVRDNAVGGGCNDHDDVTVNTTSTAGPFIVNYPSLTGISWAVGDTRTVTWSVANTDVAPVACANVNIMLSVDGGETFTTLLSNTPNDGSQDILVPNSVTTTAIIMVICENGTFFDISNNFFEITTGVSCNGPSLPVLAGNNTMCLGGSATLTITGGSLNDATDWHWYTGSCGGTPVGTGISITASSPGIYYVRGEGGCVTPGNCSTVNLQIQTIVNTVVVSGMQMTANQSSATYQWIDCKNGNALINGATAQSYTAPNDGEYAVIITRNGCSDTSNCITINNADIENLNLVNVQLYPNPVVSILTVDFGQPINLDVIELTDALGRIIQTFKNFNGNQIHIDLEKESDGVYFLNLNLDQNTKTLRIIKQ
jgi:hypothetical protein